MTFQGGLIKFEYLDQFSLEYFANELLITSQFYSSGANNDTEIAQSMF